MTKLDLVSLIQAFSALYVLGLRSELMCLAFSRARTPLFGGCAAYPILQHMNKCSLMLDEIDLDGGVGCPNLLKDL